MHPFAEVWQFVLETKREQEGKNRHTMRKVVRQHTPLVDAAAIFLQQMWRLKRLSRRLVVAAARNGEAKHRRWHFDIMRWVAHVPSKLRGKICERSFPPKLGPISS